MTPHTPLKSFESCQKVIGILDMAIIDHWQKFEYDQSNSLQK